MPTRFRSGVDRRLWMSWRSTRAKATMHSMEKRLGICNGRCLYGFQEMGSSIKCLYFIQVYITFIEAWFEFRPGQNWLEQNRCLSLYWNKNSNNYNTIITHWYAVYETTHMHGLCIAHAPCTAHAHTAGSQMKTPASSPLPSPSRSSDYTGEWCFYCW